MCATFEQWAGRWSRAVQMKAGYPLYFEHPEEIPDLASEERVEAASRWLRAMDMSPWSLRSFVRQMERVIGLARG